jgi:protein tyrosine phosphatase
VQIGDIKKIDNNIELCLEGEFYSQEKSLIRRDISVKIGTIHKIVTQIQVLNWPDHCSPEQDLNSEDNTNTLTQVLSVIHEFRCNDSSPVAIHCSAGTGRTGTLIAIYNIIKCLSLFAVQKSNYNEVMAITPFFSVFNTVRKLREQRTGMVSSVAQYKYIYEYVLKFLSKNFN